MTLVVALTGAKPRAALLRHRDLREAVSLEPEHGERSTAAVGLVLGRA